MTHNQVLSLCAAGGFALVYLLSVLVEFFTRRPRLVPIKPEDKVEGEEVTPYESVDLGCLTFVSACGMVICAIWFLCELIPG